MRCKFECNADKYDCYINGSAYANGVNICCYKTYDTFYDEYIFFISASNYKKVHQLIKNSVKEKNIVCSYEVSGKYDFIVKSFYSKDVSPSFSDMSIIKDIQIYKVIDRYAPQSPCLVREFDTTNYFHNIDVKLSEFNLFADFIRIEASTNNELSDDLVNALENVDNNENLKYVYAIYKLEDISNQVHIWLICLRYKCYEYNKRYFLQEILDTFVDARAHIKNTYISNRSNIRKNNIKIMFENMHYENVLERVLYADDIRKKICKIYRDLTNFQGKDKYIDTLRTQHNDFYNDLLCKVRNYIFYFSYKQSDGQKIPDDSTKICDSLYSWFNVNEFRHAYRAKERIKYSDDIMEYMKELGEGDLVVFCLSDKFFQANSCMYELLLVAQNNKEVQNFIKEKMIFITSKFLLNDNKRNEIKEYWKKKLLQEQNQMDKDVYFTIINNLDFIDKTANILQIELIEEENPEIMHYEKAIEAILANIVEKVLTTFRGLESSANRTQ